MKDSAIALDPPRLKALAHPLRLRLLSILRTEGPATATELAHTLGDTTSGTTSYHLRQLADHGFVVEAPEQPKGRHRRWEAAHTATRVDAAEMLANEETEPAMQAMLADMIDLHGSWVRAWLEAAPTAAPKWAAAARLTDLAFRLSPDQLAALVDDLTAVFDRYRDVEADATDSRPVSVCLYAIPRVDVEPVPTRRRARRQRR